MVERFNGRVGSEVLGITIWSHAQLEQLLRGFNAAYNAWRQRVLDGKTPDQVVRERLGHDESSPAPNPKCPKVAPGQTTSPTHASSLRTPRRFHNQTITS
jgi:hypothetical protein